MKQMSCRQAASECATLSDSANDAQSVSNLIGDVYDAALDQALWQGAIARVAAFVGGTAASMFSKDAAVESADFRYRLGQLHCDVGIEPYYRQLYFDRYVALDPVTTGHFL